jgi:hypothetical protein
LTSIIFEGDRPTIESTGVYENASSPIIYYYSNTTGWGGITSINGYSVIPVSKYTMGITSGGQTGQPPAGTTIFDGYIVVNNNTNLIIGIYETGDTTNYLLPATDSVSDSADNNYPISYSGVNFYSNTLQTNLNESINKFNLYQEDSVYILFRTDTDNIDTSKYNITIT